MNRKSKAFFYIFFLAIFISIGFVYYHTILIQDYMVFTDPDTVPAPTDFIGTLFGVTE